MSVSKLVHIFHCKNRTGTTLPSLAAVGAEEHSARVDSGRGLSSGSGPPPSERELLVWRAVNSLRNQKRDGERKLNWQRRRNWGLQKIGRSNGKDEGRNENMEIRQARGEDHGAAFIVSVPLEYGHRSPDVRTCGGHG